VKALRAYALLLAVSAIGGCSLAGEIGVSHPRVWRQEAIAQDASRRLEQLRDTQKELSDGLKNLAGWRLRKEIIETQLRASAVKAADAGGARPQITAPEPPKVSATEKIPELKREDLGQEKLGEETLDLLRRQEDFGDLFTGTLLKYIRDDHSLRSDHELYLLSFDISANSGGWTGSSGWLSSGYSAHVRIDIEDPIGDVRVYAIAPQQYSERFKEGLARRNDLSVALDVEGRGPGEGARFALDRARRSQEELALIQRYPLISGFIEGKHSFGWKISPRFRITDKPVYLRWLAGNYGIESGMEDGVRSVLAAIEIRRGPAERDKDKSIKLNITTYWESVDWHHRISDAETRPMTVTLPKDPEKKFHGTTPVRPNTGPGNIENVITIRGNDFGTRADVYVGSMKACAVQVLSRKFMEVKLPKCYEGYGCGGKPLEIKIISHGDSYLDPQLASFTYTDPLAKVKEGARPDFCEAGKQPEKPSS